MTFEELYGLLVESLRVNTAVMTDDEIDVMISLKAVRNITIRSEYHQRVHEQGEKAAAVIHDLKTRYGISERQIWNILKVQI